MSSVDVIFMDLSTVEKRLDDETPDEVTSEKDAIGAKEAGEDEAQGRA